MIGRSFRSVGWVAAVGGAALGCYMLSLRVATERADLAKVERQIIATKQQIRSLQTELGTRGRLSQLERWNAEVLALSAPASGQFMQSELALARLDQRQPTIEERAPVRMASMAAEPAAPAPARETRAAPAVEISTPPAGGVQPAVVHRASFAPPPSRAAAEAGPEPRLDSKLAEEIGAAARTEKTRGAAGRTSGNRTKSESGGAADR
jgi:hypothetical protein